ncbi:MAG: homoserine kinase [Candidatus Bathyarchaeota archaeon]|nr:homoserine kinase [Candidatus Bathyarchaeota archaeon]
MPPREVTVKAPATSANLGPGFDIFGLALNYPTDKVTITLTDAKPSIKIEVFGVAAQTISTAPERNTAGVVANQILREYGLNLGINIKIEKGIWPSRGLGSSAASAAATVFGLNHLLNLKLSKEQLVRFAAKGEVASAGSAHADNVSAAIYGNFVIVKAYNPVEVIGLKAPPDMEICIAFPQIVTPKGKTVKARSVLPKVAHLEKVIYNTGKVAAMVSGFYTENVELIGQSMSDAIVEPARAFLIPSYVQVKESALKAGACGFGISGAGPAVIAIVNRKKAHSEKVAQAMKESFEAAGLDAIAFTTRPGEGVSLMEK